jgi:hypothetical protein
MTNDEFVEYLLEINKGLSEALDPENTRRRIARRLKELRDLVSEYIEELEYPAEPVSEANEKALQAGAPSPDCPNNRTVISTSPDPTESGKRGE